MNLRQRVILWIFSLLHLPASATSRNPLDIPLREYAVMLAISIFGGAAAWFIRFKRGHPVQASVMALIGEAMISAFAGMMAFFLCEAFNVGLSYSIFIVAMSGHMGVKAIALFEKKWSKAFGETGAAPLGDK